MKNFNGKAIYQPAGKAAEYAKWACNFYAGCSNGCTYCYLKKGRGAKILGGDKPTLKKCFKDEQHAMEVFNKELYSSLPELQKHGLFFSFSTDPMLYETKELTMLAINICLYNDVPVKILTKCATHIGQFAYELQCTDFDLSNVAFGFTLTGEDELEPGASTNQARIEAMRRLHAAGFKTFASIEPIIDFYSSWGVVLQTLSFCDLYKIGLLSGKKYDKSEVLEYLSKVILMACCAYDRKVYFKDSLLKAAGIERSDLPENCVSKDYNIFNQ